MVAAPLAAQTPEERTRLDSLRASIQAVSDSAALIRRERERIAVARVDRDDPFIHMELAYVSSRLGEITSARKRWADAASEFQWAGDLRPGWAYAWYGLGVAELATGEHDVILLENIRQMLGMDFLSRAARAFARAVEADPAFSRALVDLANTALRQRIAPRLLVAQGALRLASATAAGRDPEILLLRGRIERRLGAHDSAVAVFARYAEAGGDRGVGGIERARTLAVLGRPDASRATFDSAVAGPFTDSTRREVGRDLRWIASASELAAYRALPAESAGAWVRRFWDRRDAAAGRRPGERLVEHFRRVQYVTEHFTLVTRRRAYDPSFAYRDTTQAEVDDRGVIYLRHGEPDERARFNSEGLEPNESWLYRRQPPEPDLVLHFVARGDVQDYRLVESLADVLGGGPAAGLAATAERPAGPMGLLARLYASRARFGPLYEMISRGGSMTPARLAEERHQGQQAVRTVLIGDSYRLRFAEELRPVISWFAVADDRFVAELHVVFAIPVRRLHAVPRGTASTYPLNLRLAIADSTGVPVVAVDTTRTFLVRGALGEGSYLTEQLVLRVPGGSWRATFVVLEPHADAGSAVAGVRLDVPRFDAAFGASDLILGREGSGLVWRRAEGDVPLNPLSRFPRGGTATLYYELYGLPQGAVVPTRVRIERRGGRSLLRRLFGGGSGADLAYSTVTDAEGRAHVRQRLGLEGLSTGRYTLVVELAEPGSTRAIVRRSPFEIENRDAP